MDILPLFWAWLAGFVDGEGSFRISRQLHLKGYHYQPRLEVTNTDSLIISHIHAVVKMGSIQVSRRETIKHDQGVRWIVSGRQAISVVQSISPYLRVKQVQAKVLLRFPMSDGRAPLSSENRALRAQLHGMMRQLNERGPYDPDND